MNKMSVLKEVEPRSSSWRWTVICALAITLAACGGNDDNNIGAGEDSQQPPPVIEPEDNTGAGQEQQPTPPKPEDGSAEGGQDPAPEETEPGPSEPALGDLLQSAQLRSFSSAEINAALQMGGSKLPGLQARYGVTSYRLSYLTEDQDGKLLPASGLVVVPDKGMGAPASPLISYQHATIFYNAEAPSLRIEPTEPPMVLAALGFIVVAADYVGFGDSQGEDHPYLQSRPTARAVLDMLTAAKQWQLQQGKRDNGQLYLLGYSEGGYATLAAQREMELGQHPLLPQLQASIPGGGPYDVQATLDGLLQQIKEANKTLGAVLKPGHLSVLNHKIREEVRRLLLRQLVPDDADVAYGPRVLDDYLGDKQDRIEAFASVHWGWTPSAPVYLFHGPDDQTVPFAAAQSAYDSLQAFSGGARVTLNECVSQDRPIHTGCVPEYFGHVLQVLKLHGAAP